MTITYPEQAVIKTDGGIFHLKISSYTNRNSGEIENYTISIGSTTNKCVQLNVPSRTMKNKNGYLMWVLSDDNCSFETYIKKGLAQHMVLLGLTLARDINPTLEGIKLDDTSNFKCLLPNKSIEKVPMKEFHIAFHGSTWYEYYFNAILQNNHDIYLHLKQNLYNPDIKPDKLDFINDKLQEELDELYNKTHTWADFFKAISDKYGRNKCSIVYSWITKAIHMIFNNNSIYANISWYIPFTDNDKVPLIQFEAYEYIKGGGTRRKSRVKSHTKRHQKSKHKLPTIYEYPLYLFINIPEVQAWDYSIFFS